MSIVPEYLHTFAATIASLRKTNPLVVEEREYELQEAWLVSHTRSHEGDGEVIQAIGLEGVGGLTWAAYFFRKLVVQ